MKFVPAWFTLAFAPWATAGALWNVDFPGRMHLSNPTHTVKPDILSIFISANRSGYLQPCGCSSGQVDLGLAVESENLKAVRKSLIEKREQLVLVDIGNFTSTSPGVTEAVVKALKLIGYSLVCITKHDLNSFHRVEQYLRSQGITAALYGEKKDLVLNKFSSAIASTNLIIESQSDGNFLPRDIRESDPKFTSNIRGFSGITRIVILPYELHFRWKVDRDILSVTSPPQGSLLLLKVDRTSRYVYVPSLFRLNEKIGKDPVVDEVVQNHYLKFSNDLQGHETSLLADNLSAFSPPENCRSCHQSAYKLWQLSRHAKAINILVAKKRLVTECISCHDSKFQLTGIYRSKEISEGVSCSSCHGDGLLHSISRKKTDILDGTKSCIGCHNAATSPKFQYDEYYAKIAH